MNSMILRHHQVSVLLEFFHCLDRLKTLNTDAFEHFLPMFSKGALDVAECLAFLHANDSGAPAREARSTIANKIW